MQQLCCNIMSYNVMENDINSFNLMAAYQYPKTYLVWLLTNNSLTCPASTNALSHLPCHEDRYP